jgi:transcriptional regulator with XRE-family HTH domain
MARMKTNSPDTTAPIADYSDRIRAERQKRAWTQERLAEASNLSVRTVQRLECGETPSPETLKMLAAAFGITPEELRRAGTSRTLFVDPSAKKQTTSLLIVAAGFTLVDLALFAIHGFTLLPASDKPAACMPYIVAPVCVFLWLVLPALVVTGYALRDGKLLVNRIGWAKHYDLKKATTIARCPRLGKGMTSIGVFLTSLIQEQNPHHRYGTSIAHFVTNTEKAVMIEFGGKILLVSPDDPDAFIAAVRENVRSLCDGRELGIPPCLADFAEGTGDYSDKIRTEREKRSWTQEELADKSGLSTRTVQRLEKGAPPSIETLRRLAEAFGIEVSEMETKPIRKTFRASWPDGHINSLGILATGLIIIMLALIIISLFTLSETANYICNAFSFLLISIFFTSVAGFRIKGGKLIVFKHPNATPKKYDLTTLTGMEINPQALLGSLPLTYPFNIFTPIRRSALLGTFRAFVTDETHCVVMEFGKKKIVVTPDDPQAFVEAIREELRALSGENDTAQEQTVNAPTTRP